MSLPPTPKVGGFFIYVERGVTEGGGGGGGGGGQQIQLRTEDRENGNLRAVAP